MWTKIYLIRHGETIWNKEQRMQGFTDVELSELGIEQAKRLSNYLSREKLSAIYSSDLSRAYKTAKIIAKPHNLEVKKDKRFRELHQGELEGKTFSCFAREYSELFKKWVENPKELTIPGGESLIELQERAYSGFMEIFSRHKGETIAIVAHNLCNATILCKIMEMDLNSFRRIRQYSGALNEIQDTPYGLAVIRLNDTHFLEEEDS